MQSSKTKAKCHPCRKAFKNGLCRQCYKKKVLARFYAKEEGIHNCPYCKKPMKNTYDSIEKKKSKYNFKCDCKDFPKDLRVSIG